MSTRSMLHQAKLNEWASRFAEQKSSGLSVPAWCEKQGISKYKFFYWKRQLKDELVTQALPDIVPLPLPTAQLPEVNTTFATAPIPDRTTRASCTTFATCSCARIYINGMTIEFDASASANIISNVIKAVRHA